MNFSRLPDGSIWINSSTGDTWKKVGNIIEITHKEKQKGLNMFNRKQNEIERLKRSEEWHQRELLDYKCARERFVARIDHLEQSLRESGKINEKLEKQVEQLQAMNSGPCLKDKVIELTARVNDLEWSLKTAEACALEWKEKALQLKELEQRVKKK